MEDRERKEEFDLVENMLIELESVEMGGEEELSRSKSLRAVE